MKISVIQLQRPQYEFEIVRIKEKMCDTLKRLNAGSGDYFDFGENVKRLLDAAHSLGYLYAKEEEEMLK